MTGEGDWSELDMESDDVAQEGEEDTDRKVKNEETGPERSWPMPNAMQAYRVIVSGGGTGAMYSRQSA